MSDDTLLPSEPSEQQDTGDAEVIDSQTEQPKETSKEVAFKWSEDLPGEGEAPEWFKSSKYKSVADQAKAYTELEKRFGGFSGAPESYEMPEEIDQEDTFVKALTEIGYSSNMSQDTFIQVLELGEQILSAKADIDKERELEALGSNAEDRIRNVDGFLRNNLGDKYEDLAAVVNSAKAVELVESLIKSTKTASIPTSTSEPVNIPSQGDIERMMTEKDDSGRVIYHYSKSRQQEVQNAIARMHGSH